MKLVLKNGKRKHTFFITPAADEATLVRALSRLIRDNAWGMPRCAGHSHDQGAITK